MTDLLPCPFCGGEAEYTGAPTNGYHVECKACLASSGWGDYGYQVQAKWNARAALSAQPPAPECNPATGELANQETDSTYFKSAPGGREAIAKAIHSRRYHLDAKDTDSMFAWYAENPHGTDKSRLAVYSAFKDADAVLAVLSLSPQDGGAALVFERCAKIAEMFGVGRERSSYGGSDIATRIRADAIDYLATLPRAVRGGE